MLTASLEEELLSVSLTGVKSPVKHDQRTGSELLVELLASVIATLVNQECCSMLSLS